MRNAMFILLTATLLAGSAFGAPAPPALVTTCPYFIHTSGSYLLDADMSCPTGVGIAILASNVDLDLKGHTITGSGAATGVGIGTLTDPAAMAGTCVATKGIHIHGGSVTGFLNALVLCSPGNVTGNTQATVDYMKLSGSNFGVLLGSSAGNKIENNSISKNSAGIVVTIGSTGNDFGANLFDGNSAFAILLAPGNTGNNLHGNVVTNTLGPNGLLIQSNSNTVQGNFVTDTTGNGIEVQAGALGNKITGNTALFSGVFDLKDDGGGNCTFNTWQNNLFGSGSPGCIQ